MQSFTKSPRRSETTPAATQWTRAHLARIAHSAADTQKAFRENEVAPIDPDRFFWDSWPLQTDAGDVVEIDRTSIWIALSARRTPNEMERHDHAHLRLLILRDGAWIDCGDLLPDALSPGTRQWSGSARLDKDTGKVTLWFTAAGRKNAPGLKFEQRLFHVVGWLDISGNLPKIGNWEGLTESVVNDGAIYQDLALNQGVVGRIKGFRDPYWFRDPKDDQGYILFTGSKNAATSRSSYDGVIGIARASDPEGLATYVLLPPIVDGDDVVSELERPHMFCRDGLYYLFWSTQASMFAPNGPSVPTGLFGMVGPSVSGPFEPLNGSGLVLANPTDEPEQAYAWQVLPSLEVTSFIDHWGKPKRFIGTLAPTAFLELDGANARLR
jgi:levansucrase